MQDGAETPLRVTTPDCGCTIPEWQRSCSLFRRTGTADDDAISPHSPAPRRHGGFTLIELLIVVAMIAVLATIAFPILLRARITSNEGVAVASLRTIHSAQAAFASTCGAGGYAQSLEDLAKKPPGSPVGFIQDPYVTNGVIRTATSPR